MTGLFLILPALVVGFIIGRKWQKLVHVFSPKKKQEPKKD